MVKIEQKNHHQIGNSLGVILPAQWLRKFRLMKNDAVDLVILDDMIVVIDRSVDFDAEILKKELDLAQKTWDLKEEQDEIEWFKKLSPKERAKIRKMREEAKKAFGELEG